MGTATSPREPANTAGSPGLRVRLAEFVPLVLVTALSLALLIYVGYGETKRSFSQFHIEKLQTQGAMMQSLVQDFVQEGLPLEFIETFASGSGQLGKFAGFTAFQRSPADEGRRIGTFTLLHPEGDVAFSTDETIAPESEIRLPPAAAAFVARADEEGEADPTGIAVLDESDESYRLWLSLTDETDVVGFVQVTLPKVQVDQPVNEAFVRVAWIGGGILLAFSILAFWLSGKGETVSSLLFIVAYLGMSGVLVTTMVQTYSDGAQTKTRALFDSLNQRLTAVVDAGMEIDNVDGLLDVFNEYTARNPEIAAVALIVDGVSTVHTEPAMVGKDWHSNPANIEYTARFDVATSDKRVALSVALPSNVVRDRIARSIKNFSALFVASGFIAFLFLSLGNALRRARVQGSTAGNADQEAPLSDAESDLRLSLIRPVWFLAVFVEGLFTAFLPQYMVEAARADGLAASWSTLPFTAFFLAFVVALIPAGRLAERIDIKKVLAGASVLYFAGLAALLANPGFEMLVLVRTGAGFAQGAVFIAVQSYILKSMSESRKTRGSAIIVFAFNTGILSGAAIGALLVVFIGAPGVFAVAAATSAAMLLFVLLVLPNVGRAGQAGIVRESLGDLTRGAKALFSDLSFVTAFLFVGITSKAVLTGVAIFALPLIMARQGYAQEDIGQILMFFAGGVLAANHWSSTLADKFGRTTPILLVGMLGSSAALVVMGLSEEPALALAGVDNLQALTLIGGVLLLGLAQGCINAPIVTHIMHTPGAEGLGRQMTTTVYRVMERLGHAAGPLVVGQLLLLNGQKAETIGYIGAAMVLFTLLFLLGVRRPALRHRPRG